MEPPFPVGPPPKPRLLSFNSTVPARRSPAEHAGAPRHRFLRATATSLSVNFEAVQPYTFPLRIYGDRGTIVGNRLYAPRDGQGEWGEIPGIPPDSSDVSHHPFQAEIDHFVQCVDDDLESHCNLDDAIKTHDLVFAAQQCYAHARPVRLPVI